MLGDKREVFGRLTQCWTGHGYTGEFYRRFVPDESSDCPCGKPLQTREHIIRDCARYEAHRDVLRKVSATLSLPEILGTRKGLEDLAAFLEKSAHSPRLAGHESPHVHLSSKMSSDDDDDDEEHNEREQKWTGVVVPEMTLADDEPPTTHHTTPTPHVDAGLLATMSIPTPALPLLGHFPFLLSSLFIVHAAARTHHLSIPH